MIKQIASLTTKSRGDRLLTQLQKGYIMSNLIRQWNGRTIRQRADGYMSATDMCQACNKRFYNWERTDAAKEYLEALQNKRYSDLSNGKFIDIVQGGIPELQGTWVYRKVAIRLAQWLSPDFAIQVDEWTEDLMLNGKVELQPQPVNEVKKTIEGAKALAEYFTDLGIEKVIAQSMSLDAIAVCHPEFKVMCEPAKKLLSVETAHESVGLTPTQIGNQLDPTLSPKFVNELLEDLEFQFRQPKKKKGKDSYEWQFI